MRGINRDDYVGNVGNVGRPVTWQFAVAKL